MALSKLVLHGRIPMLNKLTSSFISQQKIIKILSKKIFFGELLVNTYVTRDTEIIKIVKKLIWLRIILRIRCLRYHLIANNVFFFWGERCEGRVLQPVAIKFS